MEKEKELTEGCDKLSRVYDDMFHALQDIMQNEDKFRELSPLDYSALGMYIGKFVEQDRSADHASVLRY